MTLLALTEVDEASILIGPEGGLSEIEINQANQAGYRSLLLGSRVSFESNHTMLSKNRNDSINAQLHGFLY
jgi:hypothetical protein